MEPDRYNQSEAYVEVRRDVHGRPVLGTEVPRNPVQETQRLRSAARHIREARAALAEQVKKDLSGLVEMDEAVFNEAVTRRAEELRKQLKREAKQDVERVRRSGKGGEVRPTLTIESLHGMDELLALEEEAEDREGVVPGRTIDIAKDFEELQGVEWDVEKAALSRINEAFETEVENLKEGWDEVQRFIHCDWHQTLSILQTREVHRLSAEFLRSGQRLNSVTYSRQMARAEAVAEEVYHAWFDATSHMTIDEILAWKNPRWEKLRRRKEMRKAIKSMALGAKREGLTRKSMETVVAKKGLPGLLKHAARIQRAEDRRETRREMTRDAVAARERAEREALEAAEARAELPPPEDTPLLAGGEAGEEIDSDSEGDDVRSLAVPVEGTHIGDIGDTPEVQALLGSAGSADRRTPAAAAREEARLRALMTKAREEMGGRGDRNTTYTGATPRPPPGVSVVEPPAPGEVEDDGADEIWDIASAKARRQMQHSEAQAAPTAHAGLAGLDMRAEEADERLFPEEVRQLDVEARAEAEAERARGSVSAEYQHRRSAPLEGEEGSGPARRTISASVAGDDFAAELAAEAEAEETPLARAGRTRRDRRRR